jgi:hypothetical protein
MVKLISHFDHIFISFLLRNVRSAVAQLQMYVTAYTGTSTPLCFVKAARVCSCAAADVRRFLRRHVHAPLLCQGSLRGLLRSRRCALLVAETCPRPFALSRQLACAFGQLQICGVMTFLVQKKAHASLLCHSLWSMSEMMHTQAQTRFLRALSSVSGALAR